MDQLLRIHLPKKKKNPPSSEGDSGLAPGGTKIPLARRAAKFESHNEDPAQPKCKSQTRLGN